MVGHLVPASPELFAVLIFRLLSRLCPIPSTTSNHLHKLHRCPNKHINRETGLTTRSTLLDLHFPNALHRISRFHLTRAGGQLASDDFLHLVRRLYIRAAGTHDTQFGVVQEAFGESGELAREFVRRGEDECAGTVCVLLVCWVWRGPCGLFRLFEVLENREEIGY